MPQGAASGPASPERGRAVCSDPDRAAAAPRGALALCPTDAKPALTLEPVRGAHAPRSAPAPRRQARRPATGERRMMPRDTALRRKGPATIPRPLGAPPAIPEREASAFPHEHSRNGGQVATGEGCGKKPGDARTRSASRLGGRAHEPHRAAATHTRAAGRARQIGGAPRRRWPAPLSRELLLCRHRAALIPGALWYSSEAGA